MKKEKVNLLLTTLALLIIMASMTGILFVKGMQEKNAADTLRRAGEQTVYNMLLLGRDASAGLCDVMVLVSIDTEHGNVGIMQIPRDTYFNYTSGSYKKINGAPNALGTERFSNALADAMGLKIDYYLVLNFDTVIEMVDMVSGVEIDIPRDIIYNDDENTSIKFKAGKQTLDGKSALDFLRYRAGYAMGDLGRIDAQKLFINAFIKRMGQQKNPIIFLDLLNVILRKCDTNIREQDVISLGLKCSKKRGGQIVYLTAPGEAVQSAESGAWYYVLSRSATAEALGEYFGTSKNADDFDRNKKFVDNNKKSFYDIYNKHCEYRIYSAREIENNEININ